MIARWWHSVQTFNRLKYLKHRVESEEVPARHGKTSPARLTNPEDIEEIQCIETRMLTKRGDAVHVSVTDLPVPEGQTSHWQNARDGQLYLNSEALRKFRKMVEDAEYERCKRKREAWEVRIKWVTAVAAVLAAAASLFNLYFTSRHE